MNKLKQAEVLPALAVTFTTHVKTLASDAKDLSKSYADLTERMLKFAGRFNTLWDEAHALDGNKDHGQHKTHFLKVLGQVVNTDNRSIWSRWNTIGKQVKELLPYKADLPPQRDSLYELAKATKAGKSLERWIDDKKLTSESTMREVKSLTGKKNRSAAANAQRYVTVTVTLNTNYGEAAKMFLELLKAPEVLTFKSHKSFHEALEAELGPESYDTLKDKAA